MPEPLQPLRINNIGVYGVMREASVDSALAPEGSLSEAKNFHFDRIGAATVRPGLAAVGSTVLVSRPCVGLHNAQGGTALVVFSNGSSSTIYSYDGSSWSVSLDGGTASVRVRFVDFGSYTIALNFIYNTLSSMRFWNAGSSRHWHNTGSPINTQNMWGYNPQFGDVYKSRVYLAGDPAYPSRLFYSSVISSAGVITWTPTSDFVDINPGDGEDTTGLKRFSLELLLFKPNYIYRFRTSSVDADPLIKVGTRSQESIVEGKRGLYFHHDSGFYRYSGGYPQEISRPVNDIIEAIPYSQFSSIVGWNDADHIYWSIGNVTVVEAKESVTYKNCVLRYTESSDIWTVYSYAQEIRRGMFYTRSTTLSRLVGTDMGHVATHNSGTTDLGEAIPYRLRTKWYDFGTLATSKTISELTAYCEKHLGAQLSYKIDESQSWESLGSLSGLSTLFDKLQTLRFRRIKFQLSGMSRGEVPVFLGLDIIKGVNEGITP